MLETLGFDLIVQIASYLSLSDIQHLSLTCKSLDLLDSNSLWTALFAKRFPIKFDSSKSKLAYVTCLRNYFYVDGRELIITWASPRDGDQYWTRGEALHTFSGYAASLRFTIAELDLCFGLMFVLGFKFMAKCSLL